MRHALAGLALAALAAPVLAQAPAGPEFRVNAATSDPVDYTAVGTHPNGDFVVVYVLGGSEKFAGQRFDAHGTRRGDEFVISSTFAQGPSVGADAAGGFVVAWSGISGVFGRRYDAVGPVGPAFALDTYTSGSDESPHVASDPNGNFVAVWKGARPADDAGIIGQRFNASGARLGAEFSVNSYVTGVQAEPSVGVRGNGDFVVVWSSARPNGESAIVGQRFAAGGTPLGGEFQVSSSAPRQHHGPMVSVAPGGDFQVAWVLYPDGWDPSAIATRRFDASGAPMGPEAVAHRYEPSPIIGRQAVAALAGGTAVIVWDYQRADSGWGLRIRRFGPTGTALGPPLDFADPDTLYHVRPDVSADALGNLVVVWTSPDWVTQSPEARGQRFGRLGAPALAVDTVAGGASNGNGVLEPGETVDLRPSWQNNTGTSAALFGSLVVFSGPLGGIYTTVDNTADYGTLPAGSTHACVDCYVVGVAAATRPAAHWDAYAIEDIGSGDEGRTRWAVHVGDSFADVPRTSGFYRFVETLLHRGVSAGCGPATFCPADAVSRQQMAVFVLASHEEPGYAPAICDIPMFNDVPATSPFCRWVEELARRGVTGGCGGGNYCPNDPVTREQMAVFLLRTLDPALSPPACTTPMFGDVPASSAFCRWVEELARRGITAGCGGGNYCPAQPVTREQMAVFLTTTFGLTLYGP